MSYLKRMFITNLIVCLCYTILFSVLLFVFTSKTTSTEIDNRAQATVSQIATYVDGCISKALDTSVLINTNPYIRAYANESEPDYLNRISVRDFLLYSIGYLPGRESIVGITHENDNSVITNDSSMYTGVFANTLGITVSELETLKAEAKAGGNNSIHYIISNDNEKSILTMLICEHSAYKQPLYIFLGFKMEELVSNHSDDMQLLITVDDELLYATPGAPDDLKTAIVSGDMPNTYRIFTRNSEANFLGNLTYYSAMSKTLYRQKLTDNYIFISVIFAGLLALTLSLVYLITKKTYAPIVGLLDAIDVTRPDKHNNEIDYLKNKFLSLAQQNEQLSTELDQYKEPLEEAFLKDLLYGNLSDAAMREKLRQYGPLPSTGCFITAVAEISDSKALLESTPENSIGVLGRTITGMFCDYFFGYDYFRILKLSPDKYALIASIKGLEDFKRDLRRFLLKTSENTGISLFASLGTEVSDMRRLSESFSVALNVAENRIYSMQNQMLCTPDDVSGFMGGNVYYPFDTEAAIIENAACGNIEALHQQTRMLISVNFMHKPFSAEQFSQFIFMFTSTFNRIFSALNKKCSDIFPEDMVIYLELKSCRDPGELLEKINSLLDQIAGSAQTQMTSMDSHSRTAMLAFIENNYKNDISLLDLADHMNFSAVHTSRLFKALVGQNFKEYLTHFRYEKAKELIHEQPNIKIKDLAAAVGCSSTAILSRCFVKYTGMSVGQYIKNARKQ